MNITQENLSELHRVVHIELTPEDYQERVEKKLKEYKRKANIPGFRPGMAPMGLIKKNYGTAVIYDETQNLLQESFENYIKENQISYLAQPLLDSDPANDFTNPTTLKFSFEMGLEPAIELDLQSLPKIDFALPVADDKLLDEENEHSRRRLAQDVELNLTDDTNPIDEINEETTLHFSFTEINESNENVEEGLKGESAKAKLANFSDAFEWKSNNTFKVGDSTVFEPSIHFGENFDPKMHLGISKEEFEASTKRFQIEITSLTKSVLPDLDQDFYDKLVGPDKASTVEELKEIIRAEVNKNFEIQAKHLLYNRAQQMLIDNSGISIPTEFLKKWMQTSGEKPLTAEEVESEFNGFEIGLKWQLIESHLMRKHEIKITQEKLKEEAINKMVSQFGGGFDMNDQIKKIFEDMAMNQLKDEKTYRQLVDSIMTRNLTELFVQNLASEPKEMTWDEFVKSTEN